MPYIRQSIVVQAPAERVWRTIRDFHEMSWAAGVIESCAVKGDRRGDQIGAERVLNGAFRERLLGLDDATHTIRYRIEDGPSPVSPRDVQDFIAVVEVVEVTADDSAFVSWSARWEARDDAARDFAGGIYAALLEALAGHFRGA